VDLLALADQRVARQVHRVLPAHAPAEAATAESKTESVEPSPWPQTVRSANVGCSLRCRPMRSPFGR
jgi:hypothetical protein